MAEESSAAALRAWQDAEHILPLASPTCNRLGVLKAFCILTGILAVRMMLSEERFGMEIFLFDWSSQQTKFRPTINLCLSFFRLDSIFKFSLNKLTRLALLTSALHSKKPSFVDFSNCP